MTEFKEMLVFIVIYGLIAVVTAVITNIIQIKLGMDIKKEDPFNGKLIGALWPLSLIIILGFTIFFIFEKTTNLLSIRIAKLLKIKEVK